MADIDGDGHIDLLSGSWPGELFLFRGGPGRTFAGREMLLNKAGEPINPGGGVLKNRDGGMLLIAGDAQFKEENGEKFLEYHGKRIDIPKGKQYGITGTASSLHVVDWDDDGDLDLLIGDIQGNVWIVPNEGTRTAYAFGAETALKAADEPIRVPGDAGPVVADWDGDGRNDLLVGDGEGGVTLFRNAGKKGEPKLEKGATLVKGPKDGWETSAEVHRGVRSKICVADWDGDGRLDLLLGDFNQQKATPPQLTDAEKAANDKLRAELDPIQARYTAIIPRLFQDQPQDQDPLSEADRGKLRKEFEEISKRMSEIQQKLPRETDTHGWVWLFRRKPPAP